MLFQSLASFPSLPPSPPPQRNTTSPQSEHATSCAASCKRRVPMSARSRVGTSASHILQAVLHGQPSKGWGRANLASLVGMHRTNARCLLGLMKMAEDFEEARFEAQDSSSRTRRNLKHKCRDWKRKCRDLKHKCRRPLMNGLRRPQRSFFSNCASVVFLHLHFCVHNDHTVIP